MTNDGTTLFQCRAATELERRRLTPAASSSHVNVAGEPFAARGSLWNCFYLYCFPYFLNQLFSSYPQICCWGLFRWGILFARVPSLYSRYTPFLCLSSDSPYGQRIVAEGLLRRGDEAKVIFDFCCLFLLSPKSNVIAPLLSHYRREGGNPSMGEGRQAMIPEQGDGWDYGTR